MESLAGALPQKITVLWCHPNIGPNFLAVILTLEPVILNSCVPRMLGFQDLYNRGMKKSYVYILTNKPRGVLYIGVTSNLEQRLDQHNLSEIKSFTKRYWTRRLVYVEEFSSIVEAIAREKQLKKWHRQWKINQIESVNPKWKDLLRDAETSSA